MAAQVGLAETTGANAMLNGFRNTAFQIAATYVKLHTGIPGAAGSSNAATGDATLKQVTFSAASGGALAITGTNPVWTKGADGSETITHCSVWDGSAGPGTDDYLWSFELTASKTWTTTSDTVTLTTCGLSLAPLALSA